MRKKNVFVMGLDDFHRRELATIPDAERYNFHTLLERHELVHVENYPIHDMLAKAAHVLESFDGAVDALIGHWDFPVTTMVPILCKQFGLRSPSLESVVKCDHKYWGRLEQAKVIPEHTPAFARFDPFDDRAFDKIELELPFWVKPVKSFGSQLGFKIDSPADFDSAIVEIREHIAKIGDPFNILLRHVDMPPEVSGVGGKFCIAEQFVSGCELAPEGYAFEGDIHVHGVIDMIRERKSFSRYQYPSSLPEAVRKRAIDATTRFIEHIGFDNGCFNAEYFWNERTDRLWLIEVNPRISQSHANLFEKVDGTSNHDVAVSVALGQRPHFARRQGGYRVAAKCLLRTFEDAIVTRVPSAEDVARVSREIPGAWVFPAVGEGQRLSELSDQDAYSFLLAEILVGARDRNELLDRYHRAVEILNFQLAPLPGAAA